MKKVIAAAVLVGAVVLVPAVASAQERLFDGALGAGAGALAFGPVGAVAGGVVGYTAGPNIATGLGVRHSYHAPIIVTSIARAGASGRGVRPCANAPAALGFDPARFSSSIAWRARKSGWRRLDRVAK